MTLPLIIAAIGITYAITVRYCSQPYDEYIELSAKYADAASLLTSMRAKIDDLTEKLDFSDDVRNMLGIENAKLAEEIKRLKVDIGRGEDARWALVEAITSASDAASIAIDKIAILERSLRIARHKEFKRWKKGVMVGWRRLDKVQVKPDSYGKTFNRLMHIRRLTIRQYKLSTPAIIQKSKGLKAIPLP